MIRMISHLALCMLLLSSLGVITVDESLLAEELRRLADQEEEGIQSYLKYIFWVLERHNRYPEYARDKKLSGRVVLQFIARSDGKIVDPKVAESTGHFVFGHAALQALRRVGRLPPFPPDILRDELMVEVPITYSLEGG